MCPPSLSLSPCQTTSARCPSATRRARCWCCGPACWSKTAPNTRLTSGGPEEGRRERGEREVDGGGGEGEASSLRETLIDRAVQACTRAQEQALLCWHQQWCHFKEASGGRHVRPLGKPLVPCVTWCLIACFFLAYLLVWCVCIALT